MISVSTIRFLGMPDLVVWSEITLDVALWVKNPRWPPFVQSQTINCYRFRHNRGIFVFLLSILGFFMYAGHRGIVRKYFRHCIVGKKSKMAAISSRSNNKLILFST